MTRPCKNRHRIGIDIARIHNEQLSASCVAVCQSCVCICVLFASSLLALLSDLLLLLLFCGAVVDVFVSVVVVYVRTVLPIKTGFIVAVVFIPLASVAYGEQHVLSVTPYYQNSDSCLTYS